MVFAALMARMEERARNMAGMMRRLGIEPVTPARDAGGRIFAAAAAACRGCRSTDACTHWLAGHPGPIEAAPPFCPNAVRFQEMLRR